MVKRPLPRRRRHTACSDMNLFFLLETIKTKNTKASKPRFCSKPCCPDAKIFQVFIERKCAAQRFDLIFAQSIEVQRADLWHLLMEDLGNGSKPCTSKRNITCVLKKHWTEPVELCFIIFHFFLHVPVPSRAN